MKKIISSLTLVAAALTSHIASADTDSYWGIGYSSYKIKGTDQGIHISADINALEGTFGVNTSPYIAWEGRLGLGLGDEDIKASYQGQSSVDIGATNKLKYYLSAYFKPHVTQNNVNFYGLLGYSRVDNKISYGNNSESTTDNGFSYGAGVGLQASETTAINLEWKNLANIDGGDIKGFTIEVQKKF